MDISESVRVIMEFYKNSCLTNIFKKSNKFYKFLLISFYLYIIISLSLLVILSFNDRLSQELLMIVFLITLSISMYMIININNFIFSVYYKNDFYSYFKCNIRKKFSTVILLRVYFHLVRKTKRQNINVPSFSYCLFLPVLIIFITNVVEKYSKTNIPHFDFVLSVFLPIIVFILDMFIRNKQYKYLSIMNILERYFLEIL
jgi:hypothetical protein